MYYVIIIGLFIIFYAVFIYSLCKISKDCDIRADKLFQKMGVIDEDKSDL